MYCGIIPELVRDVPWEAESADEYIDLRDDGSDPGAELAVEE